MIHVPEAHRQAIGLNDYLRNQPSLSKKVQELAMLVTARALDCQHIWNAYAASGQCLGEEAQTCHVRAILGDAEHLHLTLERGIHQGGRSLRNH
jgi:hypothetical protein